MTVKRLRTLVLLFSLLTLLSAKSALAQEPFPVYAPVYTPFQEEQRVFIQQNSLRQLGRSSSSRETYSDNFSQNQAGKRRDQRLDDPRFSVLYRDQDLRAGFAFRQQREEKPSALEKIYSERIVDELRQFGYDLFGLPAPQTMRSLDSLAQQDKQQNNIPLGATQDDFVLGIGDRLEVVFSGQRSDRETYGINDQGLLLIKDFPPIPAAGRTMGQFRVSLEAAAQHLYNTKTYVSLASVRQIGILVIGHVKRPGRHHMTVFHTVVDALMESGGIHKTGTLRQIKLVRNGRSTIIDLYALLMHGAANIDLRLRDGDRIIVPPIGPTLAVTGEAKRPGIYEIQPAMTGIRHLMTDSSEKLSLNEMLTLGGGILAPGQNRFLKLSITDKGRETVEEVHDAFAPLFGSGAVLMISKGKEKRSGTVEIMGHTRKPGIYALNEVKTLSGLLSSDTFLGEESYPLIGVIERWDEDQMATKMLDFPLRLVLKKKYDRKLDDGDIIHLFSSTQIASLQEKKDALGEDAVPEEQDVGSRPDLTTEKEREEAIQDDAMISFLNERAAFIRGAIRNPGPYPVAQGTTLDSLIAVAGGLTLEANTGNIEVTSALLNEDGQAEGQSRTRRLQIDLKKRNAADINIQPGDSVRVNQRFEKIKDKSVLLIGEVTNPGKYDLLPGDKLSDLFRRAGGLTQQAYPEGAIFSRENARKAEEMRFKAQARNMERAIAMALEKNDRKIDTGKITEARALAKELRNARGVGRITVEANPAVLSVEEELDILLEQGDRIYIPRRSLTVRVSGDVLSPATLQFRKKKKPLDYIHEAGGFTFHADKERTFVLYPNGSAQPLQVSAWNYKPIFIPPGSTIVIPRDPEPFDFVESAKDMSQILTNLAVTAIFVDNVTNANR